MLSALSLCNYIPYFQISVAYNFYFGARAQWSHYLLQNAKRPKNAVCIANYSPVSRNHFQINPSCAIPCKYYTCEKRNALSLSLSNTQKGKTRRHNSHPFVRWEQCDTQTASEYIYSVTNFLCSPKYK